MKSVVRTQVRIPEELTEWLKAQAKEQGRSMNAQLVEIVRLARKQAAA